MAGSIRRYDVQATYASLLSILGALPCGGAAVLVLQRYQHELGQIVYGSKGMFLPVFAGAALLSMVLAGIGFLLGWSSAGQRRNDKQTRSWIGFFVGGAVLSLDAIMLIAFYLLRLERPM